jgi:DNA processing protein
MKYISDKTKKLLAISKLRNVGKAKLNQLALKNIDWSLPLQSIVNTHLNDRVEELDSHILNWADTIAETASKYGDFIISQLDSSYPVLLKETYDAPAILYCRGNLNLLNTKCLGVIGTRDPSEHGKIIGSQITSWFARNNWTIVSGLAKGIDTIAHQSCLTNNGKTIAVLGGNLNTIYPKENEGLAHEILKKEGLLVSEYPYDSKSFRSNFVERDRIQAGLSNAIILIQSDLSGGSMHASKAIIKYGRYLIVSNQSKYDKKNSHPKIQANMAIINSDIIEIRKILGLDFIHTQQIIKMMSKDDYHTVNEIILTPPISNNTNISFNF